MKKNLAIFASGEGTNAQEIIDYFRSSDKINVVLVISNKPSANVLKRAKNSGIPTLLITKDNFYETGIVVDTLKDAKIDLIVLAGFLWIIPESLIKAFPRKIINIHPALLPKFGGKGMYGMNIHRSVIESKEKQSGISIHYVNEHYDEGEIISQHHCYISENDTPETLAEKVQQLEHEFFPKVIEKMLSENS